VLQLVAVVHWLSVVPFHVSVHAGSEMIRIRARADSWTTVATGTVGARGTGLMIGSGGAGFFFVGAANVTG
jgi:hypothetical protein